MLRPLGDSPTDAVEPQQTGSQAHFGMDVHAQFKLTQLDIVFVADGNLPSRASHPLILYLKCKILKYVAATIAIFREGTENFSFPLRRTFIDYRFTRLIQRSTSTYLTAAKLRRSRDRRSEVQSGPGPVPV